MNLLLTSKKDNSLEIKNFLNNILYKKIHGRILEKTLVQLIKYPKEFI